MSIPVARSLPLTVIATNLKGSGQFLHIKEELTLGEPLVMIVYGIEVLFIIRDIRDTHPRITQPWCSDDAGVGRSLVTYRPTSSSSSEGGPPRG